MIALAVRYWWAIALAALAAFAGFQTVRIAGLKQEAAEKRAMDAEMQRMAERGQRAQEGRWQAAVDKEVNDAQGKIAAARADADAADRAAGELRTAVADAERRARTAARSAAPGAPIPADDPIGLLADVLGRADARAGLLAKVADERGAAGELCERYADRLRDAGRQVADPVR